jgi:radical SAM superfamily enzyme YgiQ (UPF0313 family)
VKEGQMRITLILPKSSDAREIWKEGQSIPAMSLPLLAAYTPGDVEVRLVDDQYEEIPYNDSGDLVGITAITETVAQAYEIADEYRKRGVPVVLGGIHPSLLPDEASTHADCVVIGDADEIWPQLVEDFRKGEMKTRYRMERLPSLAGLPLPRRDLLNDDFYLPMDFLYATRGCPRKCSFCCLPNFWGSTFRHRPVEEVIGEIERLPRDLFGFIDDNLNANPKFLKELMRQLIPLKKKWMAEVTLDFCRDEEMLRLASKSGCMAIFVGFETISSNSLQAIGKRHNLGRDYYDIVKRARDCGIGIEGSFVFGFDGDDRSIFENTLDFFLKSGLDSVNTNILKPYPGTKLFDQLCREDRMLSLDWADWASCDKVLFRPKLMSPDDLLAGVAWVNKEIYSRRNILKRVIHSLRLKSIAAIHATYHQNTSYRRRKVTYWEHEAYNPHDLDEVE